MLTWWRGSAPGKPGTGGYTIADTSYRTIATVHPGHGLDGDIHEFLITPRNTALLTIFNETRVGGRPVDEGVVQELDLATGAVRFDWHSIAHVPLDESYATPPKRRSAPFDYFHVNSIDVDTDGNLLVSARNTHAVYKVDRHSGKILWRLGGKRSDFTFGPGARFAWQHDARRLPDGTLSLFARWRLLAGTAVDDLRPVAVVTKGEFETSLPVPDRARYVAVEALDEHGRVLRRSETARAR